MEPTAAAPAAPVRTVEHESVALRTRRLAAARRRATAVLAGVTILFIAVSVAGVHGTFLGYVQAGAEASMVGGVADWFAVTALFRHPLGLPIAGRPRPRPRRPRGRPRPCPGRPCPAPVPCTR